MKNEFAEFQKWFKEYQKRFGLNGWQVYFEYKPLEDSFANITVSYRLQSATAQLNNKLPDKDKPFKDIKRSAKHEALHLLLSRLEGNARHRYASEDEITESIEELVVKLEGLIQD